MEISDFFNIFFGHLIPAIPAFVFWTVAIILVINRLQGDKSRIKRFLVIGAILEILGNLVRILLQSLIPWFFSLVTSPPDVNALTTTIKIIPDIICMAGIICLFYAFWLKFKIEGLALTDTPS